MKLHCKNFIPCTFHYIFVQLSSSLKCFLELPCLLDSSLIFCQVLTYVVQYTICPYTANYKCNFSCQLLNWKARQIYAKVDRFLWKCNQRRIDTSNHDNLAKLLSCWKHTVCNLYIWFDMFFKTLLNLNVYVLSCKVVGVLFLEWNHLLDPSEILATTIITLVPTSSKPLMKG